MSTINNEEETNGESFDGAGQNEANAESVNESATDASQNTDSGENANIEQTGTSTAESVSAPVAAADETASVGTSNADVAVASDVSDNNVGKDRSTSKRAEKVGVVSSDKMTKTVVVRVDRVVKHPVYRKYIKRRKKFMAHDETGATIGDKVRIVETRPLSAQKRWRVIEILQKAEK